MKTQAQLRFEDLPAVVYKTSPRGRMTKDRKATGIAVAQYNKQTFHGGDEVRFDLNGMSEDFKQVDLDLDQYDQCLCLIVSLDTFTELGDKDYEYYNVQMPDGEIIDGISGYHLTLVKKYETF